MTDNRTSYDISPEFLPLEMAINNLKNKFPSLSNLFKVQQDKDHFFLSFGSPTDNSRLSIEVEYYGDDFQIFSRDAKAEIIGVRSNASGQMSDWTKLMSTMIEQAIEGNLMIESWQLKFLKPPLLGPGNGIWDFFRYKNPPSNKTIVFNQPEDYWTLRKFGQRIAIKEFKPYI